MRATGWSLLLPPGWWHIPLDTRRHRSVRALANRALADRPRDAFAVLRRALVAEFEAATERAVEAGAHDLYVFSSLSHGLPGGATCVATVLDRTLPDDVPAGVVAELLATRPGDVPAVLVVEGAEVPAVRRTDPGTGVVPEGTADAEQVAKALPSTRLDVHVPYPGRAAILLLSFSTTVPGPAQSAMAALFDAIAESLRWTSPEADVVTAT